MLCLAKNSLILRAAWHGAEARFRKTTYEAVSDELHLEGVAAISLIVKGRFPRITALTRSTVSLVRAVDGRPVCVDIVGGRAAIFKSGIPLKCLGPTQRCFSECLLQHFVRFCSRLIKFLAELYANTLLLQHIRFTIRRRDKHDCTVDHLTHD
jgi:hypothetical protein